MQTFLPYPDLQRSAQVLDRARLGKQRVEVKQILNTLLRSDAQRGWARHPAVKMWRGHELTLAVYGLELCREWHHRGYRDPLLGEFVKRVAGIMFGACGHAVTPPPWLGDERLHASHRSNLLRKDPGYYCQFNWTEPPDLPYYWPQPTDVS